MIKATAGAAAVVGGTTACSRNTTGAGQMESTPVKLAIIHTNDTHGYDLLSDESLGMAAAAQLRADYEAKGYEVLLLDAGDFAQGENLVNRSSGDTAVDFMNVTGYHAACLGNHEFDYGQDKIVDYVAQANFPLLSANVIVDATGGPLVEPRTVFTLENGTKVGVFGLTTPETYTKANPLFVRGLTILEANSVAGSYSEEIGHVR